MQAIAKLILKLIGWKLIYTPSPINKAIYIVYPHTSNWDFPLGILFKTASPISIMYAIKDSWFRPPLGWLFKALGGIPIDRSVNANMVEKSAELFKSRDSFYLAVAPEGSRSYAPHLKSGFYHIAMQAQVPIALAFIDYAKKEIGVREYLIPTGDIDADLAIIRTAYQDVRGKFPQNQNKIDIKRQVAKPQTASKPSIQDNSQLQ